MNDHSGNECKKKIYDMEYKVFRCFLILLLSSLSVFSQKTVTRDVAYQSLIRNAIIDTLRDNVYSSKQVLLPQSKLIFMDDSLLSPKWNSWFFLIDKHPFADWPHSCKYVFVNVNDMSLLIIEGQKGASFTTDILLFQKVFHP